MTAKARDTFEHKVFISSSDSSCDLCGDALERGAWIIPIEDRKVLCLGCSDLDHLEFLPSGDAALTRRARRHSTLSAVVLKWSRARRRFERKGVLVEREALEQAECECLADADVRARRRDREAERRAEHDEQYIRRFAERIRGLYPTCPRDRASQIAQHACLKYSGRVGRCAAAKKLEEDAIHLAVQAHIRHTETEYDRLLAETGDRRGARREVDERVRSTVRKWMEPRGRRHRNGNLTRVTAGSGRSFEGSQLLHCNHLKAVGDRMAEKQEIVIS